MSNSMVYCHGCGKEIHSSAVSCPQCGATQGKAGTGADKSKVTAGVLALLIGGIGVHKFYLGAWGWGIVYIVLFWTWIPAIVALIEGIRYLTLSDEDFKVKAAQANQPFGFLW